MKLKYVTPQMREEVFQANEYVAACWYIGCERAFDTDNVEWEQQGVSHGSNNDGTGCGHQENQAIRVSDNGVVSLVEVRTSGLGDLQCTITDSSWNPTTLKQSDVKTGNMVYWTTSADNRIWHHYGKIEGTDSGANANHS